MKVGIITFHRAVNYGAVLQAYALCYAIRQIGHECSIIDYRCPFIEDYYCGRKLIKPRNIKRLVSYIIYNGNLNPNKERFTGFLQNQGVLSEQRYTDPESLTDANSIYDCFVAGSDQVWNYATAGFDKAYFLNFASEKSRKKSYAASFGFSEIPSEYIPIYRELLGDFSAISVRENTGKTVVNSLVDVPVTVDLDPTLLLSKDLWEEIASTSCLTVPSNNILVYMIGEDKRLLDLARIIGKEKGMRITYITDRWRNKVGVTNLRKTKIEDWLLCFSSARYIITNSFHGTAFAINLNKEFVVLGNSDGAKKESRIKTLLCDVGLPERLTYSQVEAMNVLANPIDYLKPNMLLEKRREESMGNLTKTLPRR